MFYVDLHTPPVTCPEEVEETLGTPMEVEYLDETQVGNLGLNTCDHDIPLSSKEILIFDKPEPQPQPLPSCPYLDVRILEFKRRKLKSSVLTTYTPYPSRKIRRISHQPPLIIYQRWKNDIYEDALRKSDQMHETFEKSSLAMTHKLDDMIKLTKSQPKRTYKEDLEYEMVMVKMPRFMSWLGSTDAYDEPIGSLGLMNNEVTFDEEKLRSS
ncbi:hypothetical protein Tco_0481287 [Tanacetum coccineum]